MAREKAVKSDIWMPLYVADYLADTMHLSTEQHGAYFLLLLAAWKNGGSVPNDTLKLRSITRMDAKKWQESSQTLGEFFFVTPNLWTHNRVTKELNKAKTNSEERSKSGKKGAAKRWQSDGKAIANSVPNECQKYGPSPSPNLPTVVIGKTASQEAKHLGQVDTETGEVESWAA